jgi:hypothetical protein
MPGQPGALGEVFARETDKHAGGMKLRTGNSNQRHGRIVCTPAIAHNVNSVHQAASGVRAADAAPSPLQCPAPPLARPLVRSMALGAIKLENVPAPAYPPLT